MEHLSLVELGCLDASVLCHESRDHFLQTLKTIKFPSHTIDFTKFAVTTLEKKRKRNNICLSISNFCVWLSSRQITILSVILPFIPPDIQKFHPPNIISLVIDAQDIDETSFSSLINVVPSIYHLAVKSTQNYSRLSDQSVQYLSTSLPCLSSLELFGCRLLSEISFSSIAHNLSDRLVRLNLSSCTRLNDTSFRSIVQNCTSLQSFKFSHCYLLTEVSILCLVESPLTQLTEIDLTYCTRIPETCLHLLPAKYPSLTSISLGKSSGPITDLFLTHLGEYCPLLRYVRMVDCPSLTLQPLQQLLAVQLTHLKSLSLRWTQPLTLTTLKEESEVMNMFSMCVRNNPQLSRLTLNNLEWNQKKSSTTSTTNHHHNPHNPHNPHNHHEKEREREREREREGERGRSIVELESSLREWIQFHCRFEVFTSSSSSSSSCPSSTSCSPSSLSPFSPPPFSLSSSSTSATTLTTTASSTTTSSSASTSSSFFLIFRFPET